MRHSIVCRMAVALTINPPVHYYWPREEDDVLGSPQPLKKPQYEMFLHFSCRGRFVVASQCIRIVLLLITETIRQKPFEMHAPIDAIFRKVSDAWAYNSHQTPTNPSTLDVGRVVSTPQAKWTTNKNAERGLVVGGCVCKRHCRFAVCAQIR